MQPIEKIIEAPLRLLARYQVDIVIVGGVAATVHGSGLLTNDLDVCYARTPPNLERLASALKSVNARLRGAPENLPFVLDSNPCGTGSTSLSQRTLATWIFWVKCVESGAIKKLMPAL